MKNINFKAVLNRVIFRYYLVFLFGLAGVMALFHAPTYAATYDLEILDYKIDMTVSSANVYQIVETIDVQFNQTTLHGIFRDIPLRTDYGKPIKIENIRVVNMPFSQEKSGGNLRLKIGDPNSYATPRTTYVIEYTYTIGDDQNTAQDELYFDLVGTSWEIPIHRLAFSIKMPAAFDSNQINFTYGYEGATQSPNVDYSVDGNRIHGSFAQTLYPSQAFTIALPLSEGYYSAVEKEVNVFQSLKPIILLINLALIVYAWTLWIKKGRSEPVIPVVNFYPPKGLTPIEAGYVYDKHLDPYDFTSMLIYWAGKGLVKIHEISETTGLIFKKNKYRYELEKLTQIPEDAHVFEKKYFDDLFDIYGESGIVRLELLENHFYKTLNAVKKQLIKSFSQSGRRLETPSSQRVILQIGGITLWLYFSCALILFYTLMPYDLFPAIMFSVMLSFGCLIMGTLGSVQLAKVRSRLRREKLVTWVVGVICVLIPFVFIGPILISETSLILLLFPFFMLAWSLSLIFPHSRKRTPFANDLLSHLYGFKAFIENAENQRIQILVEENPALFFDILPYAMALGVTDTWAKKFEFITFETPNWYVSNRSGLMFNTVAFTNSLNDTTRAMGRTMSSTPSSSGSSSGGSSGGGSGGGGGGGW